MKGLLAPKAVRAHVGTPGGAVFLWAEGSLFVGFFTFRGEALGLTPPSGCVDAFFLRASVVCLAADAVFLGAAALCLGAMIADESFFLGTLANPCK
jgi:hypothetical protein